MHCFHWNRQAGNYAFLEGRDQCLHGRLQVTGLSGRVGEISNMFDISTTVADPCIPGLSVNQTGLSVTSIRFVPNMDFHTVCDDSLTVQEVLQYSR